MFSQSIFSRRNQHYHSQRSQNSRSKYDHYHHTLPALPPHSSHQPSPPPQPAISAHLTQMPVLHSSPPPQSTHHHKQQPAQQRPVSSYYEYESLQKYQTRKTSAPSSPLKLNGSLGSSGRQRGPYVTQVTIRDQMPHQLHLVNNGSTSSNQHHHPHHPGQQPPHAASKV